MEEQGLKEFKVTFLRDHFTADLIRDIAQTGFLGVCERSKIASEPKVIFLWPSPKEYAAVVATLKELEAEGALIFVEKPASI